MHACVDCWLMLEPSQLEKVVQGTLLTTFVIVLKCPSKQQIRYQKSIQPKTKDQSQNGGTLQSLYGTMNSVLKTGHNRGENKENRC